MAGPQRQRRSTAVLAPLACIVLVGIAAWISIGGGGTCPVA